jgi:hypothetical protein
MADIPIATNGKKLTSKRKLKWQKSLGCPGLWWARDGDHEYWIYDHWTVDGTKYKLIHVGFDRWPAPFLATVEEAMGVAQSEHDQLKAP